MHRAFLKLISYFLIYINHLDRIFLLYIRMEVASIQKKLTPRDNLINYLNNHNLKRCCITKAYVERQFDLPYYFWMDKMIYHKKHNLIKNYLVDNNITSCPEKLDHHREYENDLEYVCIFSPYKPTINEEQKQSILNFGFKLHNQPLHNILAYTFIKSVKKNIPFNKTDLVFRGW